MGAIARTPTGATVSKRERIYADLRCRLQRSEVGPDDRLVDVEVAAAGQAARDLDRAGGDAPTAALDLARAAARDDDVERLILATIDFRNAWLGRVRNARLAATLSRFVDHVQRVRLEALRRPATRHVVVEGLEDIHAAFVGRDPITVADRMAAFIGAAEQAFFAARKPQIEPDG